MTEPIRWFARGGNIARMGPYATQEDAAEALITTEGLHIEGAFVWPERPGTTRRLARARVAANADPCTTRGGR